jgi:hypothetical protein
MMTGLRTAAPRTMVHAARFELVLLRWLKKPLVEVPAGSRPNSGITTMVTLLR